MGVGENLILAIFCEDNNLGDKCFLVLQVLPLQLLELHHPSTLIGIPLKIFSVVPPATKEKKIFRKMKQPYLKSTGCSGGEGTLYQDISQSCNEHSRSHSTKLHLKQLIQITDELMRTEFNNILGPYCRRQDGTLLPCPKNLDYSMVGVFMYHNVPIGDIWQCLKTVLINKSQDGPSKTKNYPQRPKLKTQALVKNTLGSNLCNLSVQLSVPSQIYKPP